MKKSFLKLAGLAVAAGLALGMFSCANDSGDSVPAHVHTFATTYTSNETHHWHAATCEHTAEVKDKAVHNFGEWTTTEQPSEDAEGKRERKCSDCQYLAEETIAKLDHVHAKGTLHEAVASTCKTKGTIAYYDCTKSTCVTKLDAVGNPLASTESELDPSNHEGTATWKKTAEIHKETYDCCDAVKNAEAAHNFGEWTSNDDATVTADGTKSKTCSVCQYKETVAVEGSKIIPTVTRVDDNFVKITGVPIKGTESWNPSSEVFVSGRKLTIPTLIVCDHEVTRDEFKAIMGTDPSIASAYDKDGNYLTGDAVLNNPVNYVNWYAAIAYCNKKSIAENLTPCYSVSGVTDWANLAYSSIPTSINSTWNAATCNFDADGYRLPTEAEWEWLARGGENYTYAGSNTVNEVAWYTSNTNGTREVKIKKENGYRLYDMSGNVWEWCWDWYGIISSTSAADGDASGSHRVLRGGSWCSNDSSCQVANRYLNVPLAHSYTYGFRVCRTAK